MHLRNSWFYRGKKKSKPGKEIIDKLELQQTIFENPTRIIADKGNDFLKAVLKNIV